MNSQSVQKQLATHHKASRKEIFGWAMFDFANQAYTTLIITVIFGVVFTRVIVGDGPDFRLGNLLWSLSLCLSYALVVFLAPVCGAIMDHAGAKKKFLFASYVLTIISTACLYFIMPGMIVLGMALIIISNFAYSMGEPFIAGFLPELGPPESLGKISGFGWALGYVGGLFSTGIVLLGLGGITESNFDNLRLTGPLAAIFFMLGAVPTFLWLKERRTAQKLNKPIAYIRSGYQRIRSTISDLPAYRDLAVFLVSLFFAMAGLYIIISFTFIYGDQIIGWEPRFQMLMFVLTQLTAAFGALLFGFLQDRIGAKTTFNITLGLWIVSIVMIYFTPIITSEVNKMLGLELEPQHTFLLVGCLAGTGLGSVQSCARTMVGMFTPQNRGAEFFGFWGMATKLAAIFGILGLGILQTLVGLQSAVLLCLLFFGLALTANFFVNEQRGRQAATDNSL
ncbi:MFS transporter [Desulfonatronovibrio hydrogenovorans]|uniref:MFS transporter n=1 Tax=Desulfonatronovibrio hydrogenovorans TaxID=53245 RepID=UPI001ABF6758|nr:MFS transporter [Desulfonatronovibrio hydrogenovorans]